jgi:hypothetical protein
MLGSDATVSEHAESVADSHEQLFQKLEHPSMPTQIGLLLLRYCALPRLSFLARTVPPALLHSAASQFDARVLRCFHILTKIDAASSPPDTSAEQLRSQISLPVSAGGMGLRPHGAHLTQCILRISGYHLT